jgi:hypothetical protein
MRYISDIDFSKLVGKFDCDDFLRGILKLFNIKSATTAVFGKEMNDEVLNNCLKINGYEDDKTISIYHTMTLSSKYGASPDTIVILTICNMDLDHLLMICNKSLKLKAFL